MSPPPSTLEERHVLIELIVLIGVEQSVWTDIRCRRRQASSLQGGRQLITVAIDCPYTTCAPLQVRCRGLPSEIMVILEKVPVPGRCNDMWRQCHVSVHTVICVGGRKA